MPSAQGPRHTDIITENSQPFIVYKGLMGDIGIIFFYLSYA